MTNQNCIQDEIKCRFKGGNSCYYSVQALLSSLKEFDLKVCIFPGVLPREKYILLIIIQNQAFSGSLRVTSTQLCFMETLRSNICRRQDFPIFNPGFPRSPSCA